MMEIAGAVPVYTLFELARDLIEDPDDNPEYTRGILELLHDATGDSVEELRDTLFPKPPEALMKYAIEATGYAPEEAADWQYVAERLYAELHPANATKRTVMFYKREGDEWNEGYYRHQYDVIMDWARDGDSLSRSEIGHGRTDGEAWQQALAIAAAFMYEDHVDSESWPDNKIDQLPNHPTGDDA